MTTIKELFAKHLALGTFLETGTGFGRLVGMALDLGFPDIRSVEGDRARYEQCFRLFHGEKAVTLWHGRSVDCLPMMLCDVMSPALILLDAHPSGEGSFGQDYEQVPEHRQSAVLRGELGIIKARNVTGDVILIDDLTPDVNEFVRQLFPAAVFNVYSVEDGVDKVLEVIT